MSTGIRISAKASIDEAMDLIEGLNEKDAYNLKRGIVRTLGNNTAKAVRKGFNRELHVRSGNLKKSVKSSMSKKKRNVYAVISPKARASNQVFYGYALAKGTTIKAKNGKVLKFNINGKWISKHSINIPKREWFAPSAMAYLNSSQHRKDVDRYVAKRIEALEKKGKYKRKTDGGNK